MSAGETRAAPPLDDAPTVAGARRRRGLLGVLWVALVLVMLQPTPRTVTSTLPNDLGDPSFVIGILRWGAESLVQRPLEVFDAPFYWPDERVLGFSETFLSLAPFHGMLTWATGSPVTGFNLLAIGLYLLSLIATYLLGRFLLGRTDAAVVMAAVFTFTSYSLGQQSHLQVLTFGLIPLGIFGLYNFLDSGRWRDLVVVGVASVALVYGSIYYTLLWVLVAPGLVLVLFAFGYRFTPTALRRAVIAALATAALALPGLALHADVSSVHGLVRPYEQIDTLLWGDLLTPAAGNWLWGSTFNGINSIDVPGDHGFMVGLVAYVLAAGGLVLAVRARRRPIDLSVPAVADDETVAEDEDEDVAPSVTVVGLDRLHATWALLLAGLGGLIVALGPEAFGRASPYRVLYRFVPGFEGMRSSSRLAVVTLLALALLVGATVEWIDDRVRERTGSRALGVAAVALLLAVMMAEVLVVGRARAEAWDHPEVLAVYDAVEGRPPGAVLELPIESAGAGFAWPFVEAPRLALYGADEDHPRVNGYSGHWPNGWLERVAVLDGYPSADAAALLEQLDVRYVIVHTTSPWAASRVDPAQVERILDGLPEGAVVERHGTAWLVDLQPD